MGRFLVFLGLLGIFAGVGGIIYSSFIPFTNNDIVESVTNIEEKARAMCTANEELLVEEGSSTRTTSSTTGTTGRTILYYCVNDAGNRRDITGDVIGDTVGNVVTATFGSLGSVFASSLVWMGVIVFSTFIIILGGMMSARHRMRTGGIGGRGFMITVNGQPIQMSRGNVKATTMQNPTNMAQVGQMMNQMLDNMQKPPQLSGDIGARLQQLDQLYNSNLISREEYEATRQKILDDLT